MFMVSTNGKVKCMICGANLGRITALHLWLKHSVTMEQYKDRFPGAEIVPGYTPREKGDIACLICGEKLHRITATHLSSHQITMAEYREKFPYARIVSEKDVSTMDRAFENYPSRTLS